MLIYNKYVCLRPQAFLSQQTQTDFGLPTLHLSRALHSHAETLSFLCLPTNSSTSVSISKATYIDLHMHTSITKCVLLNICPWPTWQLHSHHYGLFCVNNVKPKPVTYEWHTQTKGTHTYIVYLRKSHTAVQSQVRLVFPAATFPFAISFCLYLCLLPTANCLLPSASAKWNSVLCSDVKNGKYSYATLHLTSEIFCRTDTSSGNYGNNNNNGSNKNKCIQSWLWPGLRAFEYSLLFFVFRNLCQKSFPISIVVIAVVVAVAIVCHMLPNEKVYFYKKLYVFIICTSI